jgi:hypothetical protein
METTRRFWQKSFGYCSLIRLILVVGVLFWFTLFWGGFLGYQGSKFVYVIFSLFFLAMLASGFYRQVSYGYLFLVIFLWLGFWLKLTVHLIIDYPFGEPIGSFNGSAGSWDEVLQVAIVASLGVVMGRIIYGLTRRKSTMLISEGNYKVPAWYAPLRGWVWAFVMAIIIGLAIFNSLYGIHQIGLVPRTILLWPLNAMISWMVSTGSAMGIATLLWWDISLKKNISLPIYAILAESFFSTVSLLSRGVYIFHVVPQMLAIFQNRQTIVGLSRSRVLLIIGVLISLFIFSFSAVNSLRDYLYPQPKDFIVKNKILSRLEVLDGGVERVKKMIKKGDQQEDHLKALLQEKTDLEKKLYEQNTLNKFRALDLDEIKLLFEKSVDQMNVFFVHILQLSIDRWIGLEGVMAISSYEGMNSALFLNALIERREIGKSTLYQEVCNSHYRHLDMSKYQFASLSGSVAFFYYSGSLLLVMLGMVVFSVLILISESLIHLLTSNLILCAFYGFAAANFAAQFGVAPRQSITYFGMIFFAAMTIWFVQSFSLSKLKQKIRFIRSWSS